MNTLLIILGFLLFFFILGLIGVVCIKLLIDYFNSLDDDLNEEDK